MLPSNPMSTRADEPVADWRADHTELRVNDREAAVAWYTVTSGLVVQTIEIGGDIGFVSLSAAAGDGFRIEFVAGPGATNRSPFPSNSPTRSRAPVGTTSAFVSTTSKVRSSSCGDAT